MKRTQSDAFVTPRNEKFPRFLDKVTKTVDEFTIFVIMFVRNGGGLRV